LAHFRLLSRFAKEAAHRLVIHPYPWSRRVLGIQGSIYV
jgi:hypothetical protein